jgi:hypothetical protein
MHFRKNVFSIFAATIVLTAFCASQSAAEEEKIPVAAFRRLVQARTLARRRRPAYDELRELETQIDRIEGRYSRERRPGNKTRLKKEMEDLKTKREKLIDKIREEEKAKKNAQGTTANSAATPASSASNAPTNSTPLTDASTGASASSAYHSASLSQAVCAHDYRLRARHGYHPRYVVRNSFWKARRAAGTCNAVQYCAAHRKCLPRRFWRGSAHDSTRGFRYGSR